MSVNSKIAVVLVFFLISAPVAWASGPSSPTLGNVVSSWWSELLSTGEEATELVSTYVSSLVFSEASTAQESENRVEPCNSSGCLDADEGPAQNLGGCIVPVG